MATIISGSGFATIDNTQVLITNGNISISRNIPLAKFVYADVQTEDISDVQTEDISDVQTGVGTFSFNGSISFDLDTISLAYFISKDFLCRNKVFNVILYDGNVCRGLDNCRWTSFSINISTQSIVSCSISFVSDNNKSVDLNRVADDIGSSIKSRSLIEYYNGSNIGIHSCKINISQEVTPVFLNPEIKEEKINSIFDQDCIIDSSCFPSYFRVGSINIDLNIDSYDDWKPNNKIYVGSKYIQLTNAACTEMSFSHNGLGDIGNHSYVCRGVNLTSSIDTLFTIG